jgi:hypothetical protein
MRFGFKLEDPFVYVRLSLGIVIFLISAVLFRYISLALQLNLFERSPRIGILFLVGISLGLAILFIVLGMLIAAFTNQKDKLVRWSEAAQRKINSLGILNLWLFGLVIVLYAAFELSLNALVPAQYLRYLDNKSLHYLFFLVLLLSGSTFLRGSGSVLAAMRERRWGELLAMTALGISAAYVVATFITQISAHPFSLGWSEASRYYYASLFFAEKLYGFDAPPSVLHPTRYLLQSLPFIISDTPIWLHRLWQVFLWLFTSIATAYFLQKRLRIPKSFEGWAFGLWIFLFLLLAPVYYHLQVIAILVLW